jgi:hypothetical protein
VSDVEALAILTPRQREAVQLLHRGHSAEEVAARMRTTYNCVTVLISGARRRIARAATPGPMTCPVGHLRVRPHGQCKECKRDQRDAEGAKKGAMRVDDTARSRIQADIASGKRCRRCWLLSPCADHES